MARLAVLSAAASLLAEPISALRLGEAPEECADPPWMDECKKIYLDIGSDTGIRARKFFESTKYGNAGMKKWFDDLYADRTYRRQQSDVTGFCVLGWEPNPDKWERLQKIEDAYAERHWNVHFYHCAVADFDGPAEFDMKPHTQQLVWYEGMEKDRKAVHAMDFAKIIERLSARYTLPLVTMDMEGGEWNLIEKMVRKKTLCQSKLKNVLQRRYDGTSSADSSRWKEEKTIYGIARRMQTQNCTEGSTTWNHMGDKDFELKDVDELFAE